MRNTAKLLIICGLLLASACADKKPAPQPIQPQPPAPSPGSGYTQPYYPADNDDTYVPMNYYY